jgi:hypothetical protein
MLKSSKSDTSNWMVSCHYYELFVELFVDGKWYGQLASFFVVVQLWVWDLKTANYPSPTKSYSSFSFLDC